MDHADAVLTALRAVSAHVWAQPWAAAWWACSVFGYCTSVGALVEGESRFPPPCTQTYMEAVVLPSCGVHPDRRVCMACDRWVVERVGACAEESMWFTGGRVLRTLRLRIYAMGAACGPVRPGCGCGRCATPYVPLNDVPRCRVLLSMTCRPCPSCDCETVRVRRPFDLRVGDGVDGRRESTGVVRGPDCKNKWLKV